MKTVGIFDAKTRLSEICDEVAESREPVVVTKRGTPLVRIDPVEAAPMTIKERRAAYMAEHGKKEKRDKVDFEPAPRSDEVSEFEVEG
ncbi:MAG: type II toxin-antitoxin system Phd/YefM family antitoxin [Kiritimatiellae bacterium]|nr:type II toxin-antitoxin system Phd/YefM family antitoxin [Kiritimatiellia bacterium]